MSDLKDWLARDVLIVGKLEAADEIYIPGCGYYQPEPGAHVIICESAEPLHEVEGEEVAFSVDESLASENTKLRELVRDMWCWEETPSCAGQCPYRAECEGQPVCIFWDKTRERMGELGMEVM